jgi:hypothetical protein
MEKDAIWCLVSIEEEKIEAKITHIGRGKFKIRDDMLKVANIQRRRSMHQTYFIGVNR